MENNILKEAIADAKSVREVALANAKAALEEAFTPKLQSMLSAKLSEELNDSDDELEDNTIDEINDIDEMVGMEDREELDEEIDLEEILNELELEEGEEAEKTIDETPDEEETLDELDSPKQAHSEVSNVLDTADTVNESENFDLDALLEEINNLDTKEEDMEESKFSDTLKQMGRAAGAALRGGGMAADTTLSDTLSPLVYTATSVKDWQDKALEAGEKLLSQGETGFSKSQLHNVINSRNWQQQVYDVLLKKKRAGVELQETKKALKVVRKELNEVNLLNSKLLYVNRIFKANTLDDVQKLRVVETLDKADSAKEAKLIYETIKDTFTISKGKKKAPKRSIREGLGMASRAAGNSTAPTKAILKESNDMVARMQKLANITIKQ
jgi:hypothetical protein